MNPQNSSREELELRITMLLLGELPADEAAVLRQQIAQDVSLKKLHDELQSTIGLVREVEKTPAASAEAALKLSGDRREKLLAHFKTPRPQESFWIRPMKLPALLPVLAVIVIVAVLAGMSLSVLSGAKRKSMGKAGDFEFMSSMKSSSKEETSAATPAPAAPTVVTVATAPVLAAPPAPIVLPAAEPTVAVGGVNASGGEHIAAIGGISGSTQSFYRNVNGLRADSTPATVTEIVAKSKPADSLVQDGKLLYEMGKLEESKDKLNKALAKNPNDAAAAYYLALDDQAASTRDQNSHQADVLLSLKQVEKQQEPSVSPASISGIASASGGAGGLRNQGGGGGGSSQSLSGFASTDFDAQKTQSAALPESIPLGHFPGASTADQPGQFALDKKYDAGEITKGASQLHSTEPASRARRGFSKVTPLPGLRAPAAATYDSPATLAMPDVPANQVLTSGLQQAQPNSTPVAGDIAGNDRSDLGMPASSFDQSKSVNIGNEMKLGSAHSLTDGATVDTFKTGLAQDDTDGLRYIFATNTVASNGMETLDINQALDRYAKLTGKTILRSSLPAAAPIEIQTAVSKETAIQAVQLALAKDNISLVAVGDNIIKAVPQNQANAAGGVPESTLVEIADNLKADKPVRRSPANAPVPQPEVLTTDNAFSTFSLNVSDVSFKLAEASLEKGQMPEAATIRSEEFINAFNYRDPEVAAGQPMAFASERARYPFALNRELLRFSIKTAAAGRPAGRALNLVLLLDNSGSMERADRVAIIREALHVLAGQLQPQDTVSVVTFARTARLWADGIAGDKAGETLDKVGDITPEGGTNLEEAMRLAYETAQRHYLANGMNRVVLLTDGAANLGNVDPAVLKQNVEARRKQGIALDCFGIGFEGYDDDLLEQLSRNGDGRYAFINSPEEAGAEFAAKLAGALQIAAADVKVQVEFNPERVIAYRQIGYAKHQLTKEQFRDNTVDAAEIAAQEAGNALYTVQTKPDGTGPVATVHVRYKIPGTTDYHEHSWDVAYEPNVPALEQASPAMRLAGTASAFSEWLAVSPFAQEVTPDSLLKLMSGVPEVYGADERPKKLVEMIREAKSLSGK